MTKRELIDRNELPNPNCDNSWEFEQFVDDVMHNATVFTTQDIVNPVLDMIIAEIMKLQLYKMFMGEDTFYIERDDVLQIIDKYRAESEVKE